MASFVALVARTPIGDDGYAGHARRLLAQMGPDAVTYRSEQILLCASDRVLLDGGRRLACVIGDLFGRDGSMRAVSSLHLLGEALRSSDANVLIDRYWGSYVAIVEHEHGVSILRDPSGAQACYFAQKNGILGISSSLESLLAAGLASGSLNWRGIGRQLLAKDLRGEETCIEGVSELYRGARLRVSRERITLEPVWDPWHFALKASDRYNTNRTEELATTVQRCVEAHASQYSHVLLGVSGGLDSSIVAACLADGRARLTCLTLATDDPIGDERSYARSLCTHLGVDLVERFEQLDAIDVAESHADHLPRPIARLFAQSGNRIHEEVADDIGVDAFFHGGGGDNVFCLLSSATPVADRIRQHGLGLGALRVARDLARLTGASLQEAIWKGMVRAWWREPAYRWPIDRYLLSADVDELLQDWPCHPWLRVPPGGLAGRAAHIAWLLGIENHLEGFRRELKHPIVAPLMSQPIAELCLAIPTWAWIRGGCNRAVARDAFASKLPPAIVRRRSKGTPGPFVSQILAARRRTIREMLMEGMLAERGLLDAGRIDHILSEERSFSERDVGRIMGLLDVEAWVRARTRRVIAI